MNELNGIKKTHLDWVDGARVLAILSVILQHIPVPCAWNAPVLTSSLALFFILSGYFLSSRLVEDSSTRWSYVRARILAFAKPYIVWNIIFTVGDIGMRLDDPTWARGDWHDPARLILECFGLGYAPALIPLWFLRDLMLSVVVAALLLPRFKITFALLTITCFFLSSAPCAEAWPKPYMFGNFGLGIMLAWLPLSAERWGSLSLRFHLGIVGLFSIFCALLPTIAGKIVYEPITPLGVFALLSAGAICASSRAGKWLPSLGKSVFFIYCFHTVLIALLMGFSLHHDAWSPWVWWSLAPCIAAVSFGVYRLVLRYFPRLLSWISC